MKENKGNKKELYQVRKNMCKIGIMHSLSEFIVILTISYLH